MTRRFDAIIIGTGQAGPFLANVGGERDEGRDRRAKKCLKIFKKA
jgi:hypothetical protein